MSSVSSNPEAASSAQLQSRQQGALFALLTILGIMLYVIIDIIAQLLPPHYSPIRQAESDLGVGPFGWVMSINFVVRGLLSFALIAALVKGAPAAVRSRAGLIWLGIWAAGALLLSIFAADVGGKATLHGVIHLVVAFIAFISVTVGEIILSLRFSADARWQSLRGPALTIAILTAIFCLFAFSGIALPRLSHVGGLIERLFLGLALLWMLLVAIRLRSGPASA